MLAELLEYLLPTGVGEMCPSTFKGRGMPVLTSAQLVGPPQTPMAVLELAHSLCAGVKRPNFRSGNETLIPKVTGWDQIPAGPHDSSSIVFRAGGTNQDVFSLPLFSPSPGTFPAPGLAALEHLFLPSRKGCP